MKIYSLLARYMRLCKLVTCRLGLFQLMELQSVVIGFAGSQILLFGVNLIICHQFLLVLFIIYNRVLYACCSPFESWHRFPCQNTMVLVSVHSYISTFYFPMGLSTIDSICFSSKSSVLHRIRFRSRSTYHKKFCGLWRIYQVDLLSDANKGRFSLYTGRSMDCEI